MIDLYTAATPNGWQAPVVLEERELLKIRPQKTSSLLALETW